MKINNKLFIKLLTITSITLLILLFISNKRNSVIDSEFKAYKDDKTLIIHHQSKTINDLKKENKELHDSIKNKKDVKQAAIIEYRYKYKSDTIQTKNKPNNLSDIKDSTYSFTKKSDTLSYTLKVNVPYINWYQLEFDLSDKLTLINRESDGNNETTITTSTGGGVVSDIQIFNRKDNKNNFINRFTVGGHIGCGIGLLTKKPDIYVGIGIGYRFNRIK